MLADVAQRGRAQEGVDDRVREHVGVGVALQAALVLDLDPAEHEPAVRREGVGVVAHAGTHRCHVVAPIGASRRSRPSNTLSSPTPRPSSSSRASS